MPKGYFTYRSQTIGANSSVAFDLAGRAFYLQSATAQISLQIDDGETFPVSSGFYFDLTGQGTYHKLTFINTSSSAIAVQFYAIQLGAVQSTRVLVLSAQNASTYLKSYDSTSVAGNATVSFSGSNSGNQRKQFILVNLDSTNSLQIKDGNTNVGFTVLAQKAFTIETNGTIKVTNPNGSAVNCNILEIFYSA